MSQEKAQLNLSQEGQEFMSRFDAVQLFTRCSNTHLLHMQLSNDGGTVYFDMLLNAFDVFSIIVNGAFVPVIHVRISLSMEMMTFDTWNYAPEKVVPEACRNERLDIVYYDKTTHATEMQTLYSIKVPEDRKFDVMYMLSWLNDNSDIGYLKWNSGQPVHRLEIPAFACKDMKSFADMFNGINKSVAGGQAIIGSMLYTDIVNPLYDVPKELERMHRNTTDTIAERAIACPCLSEEHRKLFQDRIDNPRTLSEDKELEEAVTAAMQHWQKVRLSRDTLPKDFSAKTLIAAVKRMNEGLDGSDSNTEESEVKAIRQQVAVQQAAEAHTYMFVVKGE